MDYGYTEKRKSKKDLKKKGKRGYKRGGKFRGSEVIKEGGSKFK